MTVKRSLSIDATETTIKVHFQPTDTIFDVYRKMNEKIEEVKTSETNNNTENVAEAFSKLPRFLLRAALAVVRMLDYFGLLPESLVNASPFHGSFIITDKNKQISQRLLNIKKTARAELAFWITGHIHTDLYDVVSDADTSLQLISVLSDGFPYANSPTAAKMVPATDTEQAFDHVLVDLARREIRFTRIGAGEDRLYRY
jgi:hypothetical protein